MEHVAMILPKPSSMKVIEIPKITMQGIFKLGVNYTDLIARYIIMNFQTIIQVQKWYTDYHSGTKFS